MATRKAMHPDRELVLEIVQRMRESEETARRYPHGSMTRQYWEGRARAFDECYTELKGALLGEPMR